MADRPDDGRKPDNQPFGKRGRSGHSNASGPAQVSSGGWKRSSAIALVLLGGGALALAAMPRDQRCRQDNPDRPRNCTSSGHGSGGGGRSTFYGSNSTGASSSTSQGTVARGGFGGAGHAVSGAGG